MRVAEDGLSLANRITYAALSNPRSEASETVMHPQCLRWNVFLEHHPLDLIERYGVISAIVETVVRRIRAQPSVVPLRVFLHLQIHVIPVARKLWAGNLRRNARRDRPAAII